MSVPLCGGWLGNLAFAGNGTTSPGLDHLELSWFGHLLAVIGLVWMINLFNFMDGIDGLGLLGNDLCLCVWRFAISGTGKLKSGSSGADVGMVLAPFFRSYRPPGNDFLGDSGERFPRVRVGRTGYCELNNSLRLSGHG